MLTPVARHTVRCPPLTYGTRSQGISQFYLYIPHTSANGLNHTCP